MEDSEDFFADEKGTLEDFQADVVKKPRGNMASRASLGSAAAMVSGEDPISTYKEIVEGLGQGDVSLNQTLSKNINTAQISQISNTFVDIMASSDMTPEEKVSLASAYAGGMDKYYKSIRQTISEESLIADSKNESIEAEESRVSLMDTLSQIDEYTRFQQSVYNRETAKTDSDMVDTVLNFAEMVAPFVATKQMADIIQEAKNDSTGAFVKTMALLGEGKIDLKEALYAMPLEERRLALENLVDIINNHKSIVLTDDNDLLRMDAIATFVEEGNYDNIDRVIDDAISLLDMTIVGVPLAKLGSLLMAGARIAKANKAAGQAIVDILEAEATANRARTTGEAQPGSTLALVDNKNPEKAEAMLKGIAADETGEVAEALAGTDRESALFTSSVPKVNTSEIPEIPGGLHQAIAEPEAFDPNLLDFQKRDGMLYLNEEEKRQARAAVKTDFTQNAQIQYRDAMSTIEDTTDGVRFNAIYGPENGGWADGAEAMEYVKFALRRNGISDEHITLLRRDGTAFYTEALPGDKGPFLVKVAYDYKFGTEAATVDAKVRYNFLDLIPKFKIPGKKGASFQSFLVDFASMLDERIAWVGGQKADRSFAIERALVKHAETFAKGFTKLDGNMRDNVADFIKEANLGTYSFNTTTMRAQGISDEGIKVLRDWKYTWDQHYWLENADLTKTLRAKGFGVYLDKATNTQLFGKTVPINMSSKIDEVYDVATQTVRKLSDVDRKHIYKNGGEIVQLRSPFTTNTGNVVRHVVADNTHNGSYVRQLNDYDRPLNYREGYYQVHYNKPHFIVERVKDANGNFLFERAIGTAGTVEEAKAMTARQRAARGLAPDADDFYYRVDVKDTDLIDDDYFNINMTHGRTAQKLRGQRLFDSNPAPLTGKDNVLEPVEALNRSIRNISRRASMRDYLEVTKARFLKQYEDVLPKNEFGMVSWQDITRDNIQSYEPGKMRKAADARTTYDYINMLEVGYGNAIDDGYKWMLNNVATYMAEKGMIKGGAESAMHGAAEFRPTQAGKKTAFVAYLALNPVRQYIVQSHQMVRLFAINPEYVGKGVGMVGKLYPQMAALTFHRYGIKPPKAFLDAAGWSAREAEDAWKQFERSGLIAAVDANNLIRGDLKRLADTTALQRAQTVAGSPIQLSRRIGFDAGENINITSAWLTHRDLAVKKHGANLSEEVIDAVGADARNFTYNMNFAGDMPYNQNSLNLLAQFLQVPHKAVLQYTNRRLKTAEKLRLVAFDAAMWGIPSVTGSAAGIALLDEVFGKRDGIEGTPAGLARQAVEQGLESMALNGFINMLSNERSEIDFSTLAPSEIHAFTDTLSLFYNEGVSEMLANTPAGQLYFGNNARITKFFQTAAGYFHLTDDYKTVEEFEDVAKSFAHIASGMSNYYKAQYALQYGQKISFNTGDVTDEQVTKVEAMAQLFGFSTMDEVRRWGSLKDQYEKSQEIKDDLTKGWNFIIQSAAKDGLNQHEAEFQQKVVQEFFRVYGDSPTVTKFIGDKLRTMNQSDAALMMNRVYRMADMLPPDDYNKLVEGLPVDQEQKQLLLDAGNTLRNLK